MLPERDISILLALVRYFVLNTAQIQRLVFPGLQDGRVARRRLKILADAHYVNRQNVQVCSVTSHSQPLVYYPSRRGCELLASHFDDEKFLLTPTRTPIWHHVQHWLAVTDSHLCFDAAAALQNGVTIDGWLNEWDVANKDESEPEKHYRLYTTILTSPKLVCVPDAAFLLSKDGHKKVHYIEQDRATTGAEQAIAQKFLGYVGMAEAQLHFRHFEQATVPTFVVLMLAPTIGRRELLKRAMVGRVGADRWRFASVTEMKPETLFTAPIFHTAEGEPRSLIRQREVE